ncbi:putative Cyclin-dependent kinase [Rubrivivax sp. A210]|uniref:protein kinase domain-containing protein n=1 Tax=Rubrivivax sp. A210 TaxID=2772301 RepID=UPI001919892D|nr:tetratricopeptide repeat protein [Rubrivivax sp. A210]CAD5372472.1 putative Cyclin-dependent kinase [Rubrivivax sp. A210]
MTVDAGTTGGGTAAPSHTLAPGTRLRDYLVEGVLGEGGFGIVYLATDPALNRRVAIKEYLPSQMATRGGDGISVVVKSGDHAATYAQGLQGFLAEARLLVRFEHPALVKVHQFWEERGTAYMVMPYHEGPTLRRVLTKLGRLPTEEELRAWLMPLLDALEVLHADNCFHRDIAPDNIVITAGGPVLLDFGAARRVIGDLTHALTAVLKPGFAPIEQYGESPDMKQGPWTDVFALSSVLYVAASGVRPTPSVERIVVDRLKPLSELAGGRLSAGFIAAVDRGLAVLPQYRPQSIAAFRAILMGDIPAQAAVPTGPRIPRPAVADIPNNLPRQRTSFVGREAELAEIQALLDASPLVTVLGMGGMGKTRLTLQAAAHLLPRYPDGAWFVDLSVVTDPSLVVGAAARALAVFDEPGRPLLDTVCAWLKSRRVLLVLDNCEHVAAAAGELVDAILDRAPLAQVLASSRELLDVPGEQAYPIRPLPLPPREAGAQTVLDSPAVRMFADRARAQQPDFALEAQETWLLFELVTRLEGIPLAIELAAARLRTMSIAEIVDGLDDRYELLAGGSRLLQRRQQTMRALVDWSYDLLDAEEQSVFVRLAVFAGGFDEDAVRAVCAEGAVPAGRIAPLMVSLVQKSLVVREGEGAARRYRLLDTLRDYAREKLVECGGVGPTAMRHCAHYFELAKAAARGMQGAEQGRWVLRLDEELENLRAAIAAALAGTADAVLAVKLAVALTSFWILRGHTGEGRELVQAALDLPAVQKSGLAKAWALYTGAALAESQGDHEAASRMLATCLALRRQQGNPVEIAATLSTLSLARLQAGDAEGASDCEAEALNLFASVDDPRGQAIGWLHLGQISAWAGESESALDHLERAMGFARDIANREVEAECELTAADIHLRQGQPERARAAAQRSLQVCKAAGDRRGEASATWRLGRVELELGRSAAARPLLQQALREFQAFDTRAQMLGCMDDLALLELAGGVATAGLSLATAADQARGRLKLRRSPWDEANWQARLQQGRARMAPADAEAAVRAGREWETEDAVNAALAEESDLPTVMAGAARR